MAVRTRQRSLLSKNADYDCTRAYPDHLQRHCTLDQEKALFAAIADNLARSPGLRREDVLVQPGRGQE
jgi:hypothetical protein